jgi:UTP--glucose-1-phosphate uridylyltransferase
MPPAPSSSILEALTAGERERLLSLGFDAPRFDELADLVRAKAVPSSIVRGDLAMPGDEQLLRPPSPESDAGRDYTTLGERLLEEGKAALVLLNGGMATRFGGRVKGAVDALPGRSFLALQAKRLADFGGGGSGGPPLLLMNSEATDKPTRDHLSSGSHFGLCQEGVFCFVQSGAPRLRPDGELYRDSKGAISIYGPGHGDLVPAMRRSGALQWLKERGVDYLLMANVDNLGAGLDPLLLGLFASAQDSMMAEVVDRLPGERGGAPCAVDGSVRIVEDFAFPDDFDKQAIPCFNTNTLWFRTAALDQEFPLHWYTVSKVADGQAVVQFERLVGQLSWFLQTGWVRVSRGRFLPVKTPEDLKLKQHEIRAIFG